MKTTGLLFLLAASAFAQEAAPTPTPAPAPTPAPSPVPSSESWLNGYMELGYRFQPGIGGSEATYRSIVNLGEGVKLTGTDFTILDPKKRLFERLRIRAYDIGDPWATFHLFVEKRGIYKLLVDYRNLTYFNNLPSYADPTASRGVFLDQQSFDLKRHFGSYDLELFNGRLFSPYIIFDRDASSGRGVTTFRSDGNEYPVPELSDDATNLYRIGTHISARRFHATVEQGRSDFRSDSNTNVSGTNLGNNLNPTLGQQLSLSTLFRATGVRGNGPYTRLTGTGSPFSWLDVYAQYTQASPHNDVHMQQNATGSFVLLSQALFYSSLQGLAAASARLPHTSASLGWELRPIKRLRATQSWNRDRLTSSSTASTIDQLLSVPLSLTNSTTSVLDTKESRLETNVFFEAPHSITLRGGHRAAWGDAFGVILPAAGLPGSGPTSLHRQIGLGGITWRPGSRWSVSADAEVGTATGVWFRTSLYDYNKVRATGRVQLTSTLRLSMDYRNLHNDNPYSGTSYKFDTHQESASLNWAPKNGKLDFDGSYEHCGYHSQISYLIPQTLQPALSIYNENCHTISGMFSGNVRSMVKGQQTKFIGGGAVVLTAGSRPTTYYQPIGRVTVPVTRQVAFFAEWRYYGLGETFYMYESFRAHLITTGLRFTR